MDMPVAYATCLVQDDEKIHCARCHETYLERDNDVSACLVDHEAFEGEGERWGGDIFHYTCQSCGRVGIEDGGGNGIDLPGDGICYEGPHTTYPDEVVYGDNIHTCETNDCPDHEELHCVRCHETYTKLVHNGGLCCIEHEVFNGNPELCGDTYLCTCNSCGQVGTGEWSRGLIDWPNTVCYEGKHTVNVEDVNYDGDNTLTCAAKGCAQS
jgi:hypothetical protein